MRIIPVNKRGNYQQLRILFPSIALVTDEVPVYAKIIYSTVEYDSPKTDLFLLQSNTGYALDSQMGLCNFLREINYMQESKIDKLAKREKFAEKEIVYAMYKEAVALKIANRSLLPQEEELEYSIDMLAKPLHARLIWAGRRGYQETLEIVLSLIDQYVTRDSGMKPQQYRAMSEPMSRFDRQSFKSKFNLSGNAEIDCCELLTYFGV